MEELNNACSDYLKNHYRSKQAWIDNYYHLFVMLKEKYGGWGYLVEIINTNGIEITCKDLAVNMYRAKKKLGATSKVKKSDLIPNDNHIKTVTVEKKPVTNLSDFDVFPEIWQSTKEKLSENGYTPKDFKRIGIEGIKDGATIDRLVDQAIASGKKEQGSQFATQFFKKD